MPRPLQPPSATKLSFEDRLYILQTVNALPSDAFADLCAAFDPPQDIVQAKTLSPRMRSHVFLAWIYSPKGPALIDIDARLFSIVAKSVGPGVSPCPKALVIDGRTGGQAGTDLAAIAQELRQKTGDDAMELAFFTDEGGLQTLVLNGASIGLDQLQTLFDSGDLANGMAHSAVVSVGSLQANSYAARKARLVQLLRSERALDPLISVLTRARARTCTLQHILSRHSDPTLTPASVLAQAIVQDLELTDELDLRRAWLQDINPISNLELTQDNYLVMNRNRVQKLVQNRDWLLPFLQQLARDLDYILYQVLYRSLYRDRALRRTLTRHIPTLDLAVAQVMDRASELASTIYQMIAVARDPTAEIDAVIAIDQGLNPAQTRILDLAGDLGLDRDRELRCADLRGANLSHLDLRGLDLRGADLTDVQVGETLFGDNSGLGATDKQMLKRRGAVFHNYAQYGFPGSHHSG